MEGVDIDKVELELENVTPLFIAGADQRNVENEGLRTPSLRGLLRWWFRAIMGGVLFSSGHLSINEVKNKEEEVWGNTTAQSKVLINVLTITTRMGEVERKGGISYLSYGVFERKYIEGSFRIYIRFKQTLSEEDKKKVIATLWMLLNLGNIGGKNRKGFGSLRVINDTSIYGLSFKNPIEISKLKEYLESNIKKCLTFFGWKGSTISSETLPPFPVIAPNFWKMKLLNRIYPSEIKAINDIGEKIRQYREDRGNPSAKHEQKIKKFSYWVTKDYNSVKSIYTKSSPSTPKGSIFGLPHQFQFQSINKKAMVKGMEHDRRASPLYIKIWKLDSNKFAIGLQLFKSIFLPENKLEIIDLKDENKKAKVDLPSYDYLEDFLNLNELSGEWIKI